MILHRHLPWIYSQNLQTANDCWVLPPEEARHITRVRRFQSEEAAVAFDGKGYMRIGRLHLEKQQTLLRFTEPLQQAPTLPITFQLILCLPNHVATFEEILRKMCELGIQTLLPIYAQHTEKLHWTRKVWEQRSPRWRRILIEACKQAKNPLLPKIFPPCKIQQLSPIAVGFCIHGSLTASTLSQPFLPSPKEKIYSAIVGCEGGFSEEEEAFLDKISQKICLPTSVLRIETAAVSLLTLLKAKTFRPSCRW
ncbi:MAG: 16S rRNA (uracil(1498)-N(3))-methyltransferase [Opitutales bacterium]|nr:16S rRNA (uracil(1498)-N(3))-methyltransferase [Opitutales bacterium]